MKRIAMLLSVLLLPAILLGGTVSGEVIYSGSASGIIAVACVEEGTTNLDLENLAATTIFAAGPYTIDNDTLVDGNNYWCMSLMIEGMAPSSGSPAGAYPEAVTLSGGTATGVDITLETSANIGGTIDYSGDPADLYVNIYDAYVSFMDSSAVDTVEMTVHVGSTDYMISDVPAGPKKVEAFADDNGNGELDAGEMSAMFEGPFGNYVIVGGGALAADSTNITLGTAVAEGSTPESFLLAASPNPFNAACRIESPSRVDIYDLAGHKVASVEGGSVWHGTDESGNTLPAGIYLARTSYKGVSRTKLLVFAK